MNDVTIDQNPDIMMGKPVIAGSRVTVELILEQLASGRSTADLMASYPRLKPESISAALDFAAKTLNEVWKQSRVEVPA